MAAESTLVAVEPIEQEWSERMAQLCHRAACQVSTDLMSLINNGRDTVIPTHMLEWLNDYLQCLEDGNVLDDASERLQFCGMQRLVEGILQMRRDASTTANDELGAILRRN